MTSLLAEHQAAMADRAMVPEPATTLEEERRARTRIEALLETAEAGKREAEVACKRAQVELAAAEAKAGAAVAMQESAEADLAAQRAFYEDLGPPQASAVASVLCCNVASPHLPSLRLRVSSAGE